MHNHGMRADKRRFVCLVALSCMGVVTLLRGTQLFRAGTREELLTGHAESVWLGWASPRHLDAEHALAAIEPQLARNEPVLVVVPSPELVRWWRVMAPYYLVRHEIIGVVSRPLPPTAPGTAMVFLDRRGEALLRRAHERGRGVR